jgi:hydroxymethylpyrimidine pyrophosphatase-like HAD family hydrolase
MVDANISALEFSPAGVSKGSGLKNLAGLLGISTDEIIMVGDAPNDMEGLKTAGFAVAMGNAPEDVKEICDTVVADNNHDGCAEAIRRFLL